MNPMNADQVFQKVVRAFALWLAHKTEHTKIESNMVSVAGGYEKFINEGTPEKKKDV